jgi:2-C-methyl-D-erythritol 4-phosphate cytidylyltransferase
VFRYDTIKNTYEYTVGEVTDDAALVEKAGYKVKLYPGSYDNIKITTVNDLAVAEVLLKKYGH